MRVETKASDPKVMTSIDAPIVAPRSRNLWNPATAGHDLHIMGHLVANTTLVTATADIVSRALRKQVTRIVFVNAHVANCAIDDVPYRQIVDTADLRFADGSGLAIAARLAGDTLADNVNGTDMLPLLAAEAAMRGARIFLLGGTPGAADKSADTLRRLGSSAAIAGSHHGYFAHGSAEEADVISTINGSGADILLVGMGVPIQDIWIARNASRLRASVQIGVGGLFDFYSGAKSRAPKLLRTLGLEWTWRLALEPSRMWRRYLIGNVVFLRHAAAFGLRKRMMAAKPAQPRDTVAQ